ncbi:MAG TPA: YicC/YloC family endoribonuclease [Edaphocola sp.]|nr:YicC/YloC family endoribonuclease [Edaphocola sp.]
MIFSMTGFGKAEGSNSSKEIFIEIKSLNGKQFDIISKINPLVKAYEMDIRKILANGLKRGSVDIYINIKQDGAVKPMKINTTLARSYYQSIKSIAHDLSLPEDQILATLLRLPEVVAAETDSVDKEDWILIQDLFEKAIQALNTHRKEEGATIEIDIINHINTIEGLLLEVEQFEPNRVPRIKERISTKLEEWVGSENWDNNRLEQELIYYIEKFDISEEKQRLTTHCSYFKTLVENADENGIGKKLGFVLQEIGREINTLGSKANDAEMQQIVVRMKDALEKAKEQVLNIL